MKPGFRHLLAGLGISLLLAACGGGGGGGGADGGDDAASRPTANAGSAQTVAMGATVTLDGSASRSPNGTSLQYQWQLAGKPANSTATLSAANNVHSTFVADKPGDYNVDLIVNDGNASSSPSRVQITATSPYPVANTTPRHSVRLGTETVGLDGTASTPPTGKPGPLSYLWTLKSRPEASQLGALRDYDKGLATLIVDVEGVYVVQLVVSHDNQISQPAEVVVTVSAGNAPPVAVADDIIVKLGDEVVLDGSRSYDPDNQPLQYRWSFRPPSGSKPGMPGYVPEPALHDRVNARARFTPEAVGDYHLNFFVYDGVWQSNVQTVKVTVEKPTAGSQNRPPVGQLIARGYYPSNSIGEQELGGRADFTFEGYDPEGEPLQQVSAELISKPAGSNATLNNLLYGVGGRIFALDVQGQYIVRVTVSDGVNQVVSEASITARIGGVNNSPGNGNMAAIAASVLSGETLFFETQAMDQDGDPLTYHWTLFDKPDGSAASVQPLRDPNTNEFSRAQVVTDQPGVYIVRLVVEDDRGLKASSYAQAQGIAKLENNAPVIRQVIWKHLPEHLPWNTFYQMLPCMTLQFDPVVVDPDGDKLYVHRDLISAPPGGTYSETPCATTNTAGLFNLPGEYVFRYLVSDGIAEAAPYDFTVRIDPPESARGVTLTRLFSANEKPLKPWPQYWNLGTTKLTGPIDARSVDTSMELKAIDGNYTIVDVKAEHVNGRLAPWFDGIQEGQVLQQGLPVQFKAMIPALQCGLIPGEDTRTEHFRFSFRIKEIPQAVFEWERRWTIAFNDTSHPSCQAS